MGCKQYLLIGVLAYIACFIYYLDFSNEMPGLYVTGVAFMRLYGYEGEEHTVVSSDGFETKIHRMGHGGAGKKVMVYVPGLHCTSEVSFALGPKHDISYSLYDAGIDLWLVNYRGTSNSKPVENRNSTDDELTNFSFHEQHYDVAAAIDYIWETTGRKKLTISGGSLGANIAMVLLAEKPEFNQKIDKAVLFGATGPFSTRTTYFQYVVVYAAAANKAIADYLSTSFKYRRIFAHLMCTHPMSPVQCWPFIDRYLGYYSEGLTDAESAVAFKIMFTGPFTGVYEHMLQNIAAKRYLKRDFGKEVNLKLYGSESPPPYNMSNIKVPIIIFDAVEDKFLTAEGRKERENMIPNIKEIVPVYPPFQHGNFVSNGAFDKNFIKNVIKAVLEVV